ncbi:MAG: chromate resistance protein [Chloroflexi bacterium]|nr:chromate resistance protein [Chloroflexota bacterium]
MVKRNAWVLLAYRIPREPSTPRISVWRKLRRLGAAQVVDGLVALPLDAKTREQLDWIAEEISDAGGDASVWIAEPTTAAQERAIARQLTQAVAEEYRGLIEAAAIASRGGAGPDRRTLARLRRELRQIEGRDYFNASGRREARAAVERLAKAAELRR